MLVLHIRFMNRENVINLLNERLCKFNKISLTNKQHSPLIEWIHKYFMMIQGVNPMNIIRIFTLNQKIK